MVKMMGVMTVMAGMLAAVAGAGSGPGYHGPFGFGSAPSEAARHVPGELAAGRRVASYAEVSLGLTAVAAAEETGRCLRCDVRSAER